MKETKVIDLTKIDGSGSFGCPHCGATIDPDDSSDKVYTVEGSTVKEDQLVELMLKCNCGALLRLTGFAEAGKLG